MLEGGKAERQSVFVFERELERDSVIGEIRSAHAMLLK